jgi:KamA family protein
MKYQAFTLKNFRKIPQMSLLSEEEKRQIEVVGHVLPFKASNYIIDELIDWQNFQTDPFFILNFPQKEMLTAEQFDMIYTYLYRKPDIEKLKDEIERIRLSLNPNPAGQAFNVPIYKGKRLEGVQHKYHETLLFFPSQGQTCHAYCTFCFRWPQFALNEFKFSMSNATQMIAYLKEHPEVSDILFTGGDPMVMKTKLLKDYFDALLDADIPHLKSIRIGTKALTYWPYRFTSDDDATELLNLFKKTINKGINISIMAHINHYNALKTNAVKEAIRKIRNTGAQIRSQSPILRHINDTPPVWAKMWRRQVDLGIIPYYMFIARDTGAQDYFAVPLAEAFQIYIDAYTSVSGICRTVRGPSMSCDPGKIHLVGITEIRGEKVFVLRFLQARNPEWSKEVFFAKFDPKALWLNDLKPAFDDKEFFFVDELNHMYTSQHDFCHSEGVH